MILIDTSVWIDYFNGKISPQTDWLHSALGRENIIVGDLILAEILQGFRSDKDFHRAKELLSNFRFMEMVGWTIAVRSAENCRTLKKKGVTVRKTIDVLIGTFCILHGISLLHDDRDFNPLSKHLGLKTVRV